MAETFTVLLTGATGFIAKHIALRLLDAGYHLRASVRRLDRAEELRTALRPRLADPEALDRLEFVALDLTQDEGWTEAMDGVDALIHTASPFPMVQPKDEEALIRTAVDGTLRALSAAHTAGIRRVILTSSTAAVMNCELPTGKTLYDEENWSDPHSPLINAYSKSKTLAEQAAWEFVHNDAPELQLTTINPGMVAGPPLDRHYGTSVSVFERILGGRDPMVPNSGLLIVDVRDVAEMHLRALQTDASIGQRLLAVSGFLWFAEISHTIRMAHPERRIARLTAPNWIMRLLGLFDPAIRSILPTLGRRDEASNARARDLLQMHFIPVEQAVLATVERLIEFENES